MGFNLKMKEKNPPVAFSYDGSFRNNDVTIASEEVFSGTYCGVNLDSGKMCQDSTYIGNIHAHPYRKRYDPDTVAIGPSWKDWDVWNNCFPVCGFAFFFYQATVLYSLLSRT